MNYINDSNLIDNNGKEDLFNSDLIVLLINYGLFLFFIIFVNSLILLFIWCKWWLCIIFNMIFISFVVSDFLIGLIVVLMVIVCLVVKCFEVCFFMDIFNCFLVFLFVGYFIFLFIDCYIRVIKFL